MVEDDYLIARDMARELTRAGAVVIGPARSVAEASLLLEAEPVVDAAVLDVNLGGETSFPVARLLQARGVPFLFSTGYNSADVPAEWKQARIEMKPLRMGAVSALLADD